MMLIQGDKIWDALITGLILFSIGACLLWFLPKYVRRKVHRNRMSEEQAEDVLRKMNPKQGYIFMLLAVAVTFMELWQTGLFGYSKLLALIPATVSVVLFVGWLRHRKNNW